MTKKIILHKYFLSLYIYLYTNYEREKLKGYKYFHKALYIYTELYLKYISLHARFKLKGQGYLFLWNIIKGAQTEWKKNKWMSGLVDNKWSF